MGDNAFPPLLRKKIRYSIIFLFLLSIVVFVSGIGRQAVLSIHFIDVGEGEAILIVAPSGETALIDAGNMITGLKVFRYLQRQNISALKHLIFTHYHFDHIGGAFFISQMLPFKNVYDSGQNLESVSASSDVHRWYQELIRADQSYRALEAGESLDLGSVKLNILWPKKPFVFSDFNNNSLVIMVEYKSFKCLLAADVTEPVELKLIREYGNLEANILKVAHHGANDATSQKFLEAVNPDIAIISISGQSKYGYPPSPVIERIKASGSLIYRTDKHGDIVVTIDNKGKIKVKTGND